MVVELMKSRSSVQLHIDAFLYYKHSGVIGRKVYWNCINKKECSARAITTGGLKNLIVL